MKIIATVLYLQTCSAFALSLTPVATDKQAISYSNGSPTTISPGQRTAIIVAVVPNTPHNIALWIGAHNKSEKAANLGTENVRTDSNGRAVRVFTYDELVKQAKSADGWQRFGLAAGAGFRAGAATLPAQATYTGQFNGYGNYGQYQGSYFGRSTTTDPAAQALAQSAITSDARVQAAMADRQLGSRMQELNYILRTTTIYPDKIAGGIVEVSRSGVKDLLNVFVTFNGEQHSFRFRVDK